MTDIIERLRDLALDYPDKPWISEAADEIGRLRAALQEIVAIDPGRVTLAHGIARAALSAGETP